MTKVIRVLLDFARLTATELLARANAVYAGLNLNPAYPNPPVPMSEFRLAIDESAAAVTAALDGGAKAIAHRNAMGEALRRTLRKLAHYVEAACNDNMTTFLSSGFQPLQRVRAKTQPVSEAIRKIEPGTTAGELQVALVPLPGAVSYELRWAQVSGGTPGDWISQPIARVRPPVPVKNLTPGASYVFQARALTPSGLTDWSDSINRICT